MQGDLEAQYKKIACGQYHSAFVGCSKAEAAGKGAALNRLHVWGNNDEGQLCDKLPEGEHKFQKKLERPREVRMMYGAREYEALSVSAGPNYTVVIGQVNLLFEKESNSGGTRKKQKQKQYFKQPLIMPEDERKFKEFPPSTRLVVEGMRKALRKILIKKGTLGTLFHARADQAEQNTGGAAAASRDSRSRSKKREGGYSQFYQEERDGRALKPNKRQEIQGETKDDQEASQVLIERQEFVEVLQGAKLASIEDSQTLAEVLFESNSEVTLRQLEDFALGFQRDAVRLFMFGKCDQKLFSFDKKLPLVNPTAGKQVNLLAKGGRIGNLFNQGSSSEQSGDEADLQANLQIITRPTVVNFPRFCAPIVQVSCGVAHILALTSQLQMFTWGSGEYGALGFGTIQSVSQPTPLVIRQNGSKLPVVKVECGALHSMCITKKRQLFAWGCGKQGRLGHGAEDDLLVPTEIVALSNLRISQVSAGESHCAAITQTGKVYVWGNGSYGRLGTGFETQENAPVLLDDLSNKQIVRVSCGAFHTLVLSSEGELFAFGQNKYGKLGLNVKKENTVFRSTYSRVNAYRIDFADKRDRKKMNISEEASVNFRQVVAGYNHSMAVSSKHQVLTWGYSGFGLLARQGLQNIPVAIETGPDLPKKNFLVRIPQRFLTSVLKESREGAATSSQVALRQTQVTYSTAVEQVQCVNLGTLVLSDKGDLYYAGDTRYGQLPHAAEKPSNEFGPANDEKFVFRQLSLPHRVKSISCGGDHLFAVTSEEKVFGWGRNDCAQLGLGFQQDYMNEPTEVPAFRDMAVAKIVCGPNYSAVITSTGRLMVAGSLEHGKLGLGPNQRSGFAQNFTLVSRLRSVKDVACGPTHMLAIVSGTNTNGCGVFAWGNNAMGQLGVDSTESSYAPREVAIKRSERFDQVCCGLDFSLGLARASRKAYMWGNIKYYGASTNTTTRMYRTPIQIKDLESHKVSQLFCSQTFAFALTESGDLKAWGEWFADRSREEQLQQEPQPREGPENYARSETSSADQDSSDDSDYDDSSELDGSAESDKPRKQVEARNKKYTTKEFHPIQSFPDAAMRATEVKLGRLAFGTEHAAAISEDGFLYTWGHNQCEQMGISLRKYEEEAAKGGNKSTAQQTLHESSLNALLAANRARQNDEDFAEAPVFRQAAHERQDEEDDVHLAEEARLEQDEEPPGNESSASSSQQSSESSSEQESSEESEQERKEVPPKKKKVNWPDEAAGRAGNLNSDSVEPAQVRLQFENEAAPQSSVSSKQVSRMGDFAAIQADKQVRIWASDHSMEQQQCMLQQALKNERKLQCDEERLFEVDKQNNDSMQRLLDGVARLPALEKQRQQLRVMIKSAFLQRITEKPLNVNPPIDWNKMSAKAFREKETRRTLKPYLQQILNVLHSHPCYLIEMHKADLFSPRLMLTFLKNVYPSRVATNEHSFAKPKPGAALEACPMVSREQERVNLLLISFMKSIVKKELSQAQSVQQVDFLSEDSLIGTLFYRVLKSQERNLDTVCSLLAHLMNKFIATLQEGNDFNERGSKGDAGLGSRGKAESKAASQEQYNPKVCQMFAQFLSDVVGDVLRDEVLTTNTANFQLKPVWRRELESQSKVASLRFSGEVGLMVEIVQQELRLLKDKKSKLGKQHNQEELIAQKLLGLVFFRMIRKVSSSAEQLMLSLYPYLRETKKNILIEEAMARSGTTYLELCSLLNFFFSNNGDFMQRDSLDPARQELYQNVTSLRQSKLVDIFRHLKDHNSTQPKLIAVKHFESALLHSLSPHDFALKLKRADVVQLFAEMYKERERIALVKPVGNDQLFRLFSVEGLFSFRQFQSSLKTYPEQFSLKIPTRQFVQTARPSMQKCKDCETVLSDAFTKLEGQPILEQYEPEDKESLVSLYCDILRQVGPLDSARNVQHQLEEMRRQNKLINAREMLDEKIREFQSQLTREQEQKKDRIKEGSEASQSKQLEIQQKYEELKQYKVADVQAFEALFSQQEDTDLVDQQAAALANWNIFEEVILKRAEAKINERISHKSVAKALQRRLEQELKPHLEWMVEGMAKQEIFALKLQLYNTQMGLGNNELRKLGKNSDQVQLMKSILSQQKAQKYSRVLYRVLPDHQKMKLRAIVQKSARDLLANRTITDIRVASLKPMINQCRLVIMEDDQMDVLVKLLFVQKSKTCFCLKGTLLENLLLQFKLTQKEVVQIRKQVKNYQLFKLHVNAAFDQGDQEAQKRVSLFLDKMTATHSPSPVASKAKSEKSKSSRKKKGAESRESALQTLALLNRKVFKDCLEFDLNKLLQLINDMIRTRYAYIFNSDQTPEQLLLASQRMGEL